MTSTDGQSILKLIEAVSPDDLAMLDEIDARVWCWLPQHNCEFLEYKDGAFWCNPRATNLPFWKSVVKYTRSRDALKAIRPDKGLWKITVHFDHGKNIGASVIYDRPDALTIRTKVLPNEYLAELHAIIQALMHEGKSS